MNDAREDAEMAAAMGWSKFEAALSDNETLSGHEYLTALVEDTLLHTAEVTGSWAIYRARIMPHAPRRDWTEPLIHGLMTAPPAGAAAVAGRANYAGDPHFYGALDAETAVAEVRPWIGARVTVARFEAGQPLTLVNLAATISRLELGPLAVWAGFMFGLPMHRDDGKAYLGTQALAKRLRECGADGVLYQSAMRPTGVNAVLFKHRQLRCVSRQLHEVTDVAVTTTPLSRAEA